MNREEAKKLAPIIAAYGEGKEILYCGEVVSDLYFDSPSSDYEIKPEPEVIYVNKKKDGDTFTYSTKEIAVMGTAESNNYYEYIAKKFIAEE